MEEESVIAYIFERKKIREDEKTISFAFIPIEVVVGTEMSFKDLEGLRVLNTDSKKFGENKEFYMLDDITNIDKQYVYAFPCKLEGRSRKNILSTIQTLNDEISSLENRIIYQVYYKEENYSKEFFYNDKIEAVISVDSSDPYALYDVIYRDYNSVKKIADEIERKRERILIPSDIPEEDDGMLYSDDIYNKVTKTVICQDDAVKAISTAFATNRRTANSRMKSNLLVCGPTGCGKSEIFRCISSGFNIPITVEDSTEYTVAPFIGKHVTEMLQKLYQNADGDLEAAQHGIVIVDEIDKKVSNEPQSETYARGVITSFLKMIEGHTYQIVDGKQKINFDTSNVTFAFLGAFSGIEKFSNAKRRIGIMTEEQKQAMVDPNNIYNEKNIEKMGLLPEFLGRTKLVTLNPLEIPDLERIIRESDTSQLLLYKEFLEENDMQLIYDDETITTIAKKAHELGYGARSIKQIIEKAVADANFYVTSRKKYKYLQITPETIENNKKYILR